MLSFYQQAVGEPPLFLGSSVFFAIKDAILSARSDEGLGNFTLHSPAVAERIRLACVDQFTKWVRMEDIFLYIQCTTCTLNSTIYTRVDPGLL